ncbi:MAG TPA: hypothetical protein VHY79_10480 [Rhizomicrobium sp.]|jgi:hypothetical protein|nr:hypothetical protein [Rhizomicrobium sp.]
MYKASVYGALAACFAASAVLAQEAAQSGPQNQAVRTDQGNNSNMPVKGANSFTETEAKSRIESQGYTQVGGLQKGQDGVWRGTAYKDGKPVQVSVDYQGNVNGQ